MVEVNSFKRPSLASFSFDKLAWKLKTIEIWTLLSQITKMFYFYTPNSGFLTFSGGTKMENQREKRKQT